MEYGIFNDEGLIEGQFYSEERAIAAMKQDYDQEDDLEVWAICNDHEGQRDSVCEECNAEPEEGDDES